MKKKAFTIPETLIFMTIVGVICVMMMTIIKPNQKFYRFAYYNAYYVLATAGYNILEDARARRESDDPSRYPAADRIFPEDVKEMCKKLAQNPDMQAGTSDENYGYINATYYKCSSNFIAKKNALDSDFGKGKESFKATNSMRFFLAAKDALGNPFSMNVNDPIGGSAVPIEFYLIWVDLNGDRGPNTAKIASNGRLPDIVPFAMTTTGKVVPLGYPTVDTTYLSARVKFPNDSKDAFSQIDNFYNIQIKSYGDKEYPTLDVLSVRDTWKNFVSGTAMEVPAKYIPNTAAQDAKCTPASSAEMSACRVEVEEVKAM